MKKIVSIENFNDDKKNKNQKKNKIKNKLK